MGRTGKIFKEYVIKTVVIGLPLQANGTEDRITRKVREFSKELQLKFNVPIELWDERYSTLEAEQILKQMENTLPMRKKV